MPNKTAKLRGNAWLVRDRVGKIRRAVFFCGKEYIPADDRHEIVRCKIAFKSINGIKLKAWWRAKDL